MAFELNPQIIRDALTKATQELPPLPNVLVKVLQLTQNSDAGTIGEIETLIRSDQAISSKVLRVVNSAYFGLSGQVSSVSQAIVILGFQQVRNLVLSVSMLTQFTANDQKSKDAQLRCWESAFGTASAAQIIGGKKRFGAKDLELCFMGGLLQNIGSLFMLSTITRTYLSVMEEATNNHLWLASTESLRLSTNHAEVGQQLTAKWKLPEDLMLLIGRHEGPFEGDPIPALYAVHAGEHLAAECLRTVRRPLDQTAMDPAVRSWLNFSDEEYNEVLDSVAEKIKLAIDLIGSLQN